MGNGRFGCRRDDAGLILPSVGFSVPKGIAHVRPFLTAPLIFPSPQSLLTCLSLIFQRLAASFVLIILCITIPHIHFYRYSIAHYRNNVKNNIRNIVRNYAAAFFSIVPIEKGQAVLPVLITINRCSDAYNLTGKPIVAIILYNRIFLSNLLFAELYICFADNLSH